MDDLKLSEAPTWKIGATALLAHVLVCVALIATGTSDPIWAPHVAAVGLAFSVLAAVCIRGTIEFFLGDDEKNLT